MLQILLVGVLIRMYIVYVVRQLRGRYRIVDGIFVITVYKSFLSPHRAVRSMSAQHRCNQYS